MVLGCDKSWKIKKPPNFIKKYLNETKSSKLISIEIRKVEGFTFALNFHKFYHFGICNLCHRQYNICIKA
jgi:hypothetical protein